MLLEENRGKDMTARRGRRGKQLTDDLQGGKGY